VALAEADVLKRLSRREWRTALEVTEQLDAEYGASLLTRLSVHVLLYWLWSTGGVQGRARVPQECLLPEHEFRLTRNGYMRRCEEPRPAPSYELLPQLT